MARASKGDRSQHTLRLPVEHSAVYQRAAETRGVDFGEYVMRSLARAHGLPIEGSAAPDGEQLTLLEDIEEAAMTA